MSSGSVTGHRDARAAFHSRPLEMCIHGPKKSPGRATCPPPHTVTDGTELNTKQGATWRAWSHGAANGRRKKCTSALAPSRAAQPAGRPRSTDEAAAAHTRTRPPSCFLALSPPPSHSTLFLERQTQALEFLELLEQALEFLERQSLLASASRRRTSSRRLSSLSCATLLPYGNAGSASAGAGAILFGLAFF